MQLRRLSSKLSVHKTHLDRERHRVAEFMNTCFLEVHRTLILASLTPRLNFTPFMFSDTTMSQAWEVQPLLLLLIANLHFA